MVVRMEGLDCDKAPALTLALRLRADAPQGETRIWLNEVKASDTDANAIGLAETALVCTIGADPTPTALPTETPAPTPEGQTPPPEPTQTPQPAALAELTAVVLPAAPATLAPGTTFLPVEVPTASPTAAPTAVPTATPTPIPTDKPPQGASGGAGVSATATPTATPTPGTLVIESAPTEAVVSQREVFRLKATAEDGVVTLSLLAEDWCAGGLQAALTYDSTVCRYEAGSAAFSKELTDAAMVSMVNDGTDGALRLVYSSLSGGMPGAAVFTARFTCDSAADVRFGLANVVYTEAREQDAAAHTVADSTFTIQPMDDLTVTETLQMIALDGETRSAAMDVGEKCAFTHAENVTWRVDDESEVKTVNAAVTDPKTLTSEIMNSLTWNIALATYDMTQARWDYALLLTYDGQEKAVAVVGLPAGVTVAGVTGDKATRPGSYTAQVTLAYDAAHYAPVSLAPLTWQIVCPCDHGSVAYTVVTEATCTKAGVEKKICPVCKEELDSRIIPALGHDYAASFTTDVEPTCTEDGSKSRHCTRCDAVTESTVLPALGHDWGGWVVDAEATLEAAGSRHRVCRRCGKTETETLARLWKLSAEKVYAPAGEGFGLCVLGGAKGLQWRSSDENVAVVSPEGWVTIRAGGRAVVEAEDGNGLCQRCGIEAAAMKTAVPPKALRENAAEAFTGSALEAVDLTANRGVRVAAGAFSGCGALKAVYLPAAAELAAGAFTGCGQVVLFCTETAQETQAAAQGLAFVRRVR